MTVNTQKLRELLKKSCIDRLYIRTNRHADTGGKRWGWTSTQPPGSRTSSFDLYWAEGDCTEARAQLVVSVINALPALLDEIDALRAELQARQWISVDERLPDSEEIVLVMSPGSQYQKVNFDCWRMQREAPLGWSSATIETGMGWDEHEFEEITHWMPLPPAPPQGETA